MAKRKTRAPMRAPTKKVKKSSITIEKTISFARMGTKVHLTFSNLPLAEWKHGVTFCRRKGKLWRLSSEEKILWTDICTACKKVVDAP